MRNASSDPQDKAWFPGMSTDFEGWGSRGSGGRAAGPLSPPVQPPNAHSFRPTSSSSTSDSTTGASPTLMALIFR